jgi:carboxymethylenebutenolidase
MELSRRAVLASFACVPLAERAHLAHAQAAIESVSLTISGGRTVSGVVAAPDVLPAPALLLFHGSSGLNDMYKAFAPAFARDGFFAAALDLFGGQTATDDSTRARLRSEVRSDTAKADETIATWLDWLKADSRCNGKIGVVGWSFGAEWALEASMQTPVDATVLYVGLAYPSADRLKSLKGPVMVHLGERDPDVSKHELAMFERAMTEAGKSVQAHWYPNDHYFPFSMFPTYDKAQADLAWRRSVEFLNLNLR